MLPAFRSEAEEGASRRRWAECKEAEAAATQAYWDVRRGAGRRRL